MHDPTAASIWTELLAGDWVIVERRDRPCERTLVLRRSTDDEKHSCAFTPLERDVVAMAMRAWSLKMMAAELVLSTSRVAEVLARVRAKLGAPTHADLLRMIGSPRPTPSTQVSTDDHDVVTTPPDGGKREKFPPKRILAPLVDQN